MAATGKTPILLYGSTTATNVPTAGNLTNSSDGCEIAINVADKNLFFKDSTNAVNTVPIRQSSGSSDGWLSSANWTTFNNKQAALVSGTNIKTVSGTSLLGSGDLGTIGTGYGGTGLTSFTSTGILYASSTSALATSSNLTWNGTYVGTTGSYSSAQTAGNYYGFGTAAWTLDSSSVPDYGVAYTTVGGAYNVSLIGYSNLKFITNRTVQMQVFADGGVSIGNATSPGATNLSVTGTITSAAHTASRFIPNSSTIPTNGMYYPASNLVGFSSNSTYRGGWLGAALLLGTSGTGTTFSNATSNGVDLYQLGFHFYRNTGTTAGRYFWLGVDSGSSFIVYNDSSTGVYLAYGATSWAGNSDERVKTDLTPIENGLAKVCSLRSVTGRYTKDEPGISRSFLIAQDVQKVLPEAVNVQDDEQGTLGLQYTDVIPLLVAAIKELKQEFDEYKATHP